MKQMVLSAFLMPGGYDARAWRHPDSPAEDLGTFTPILEIARAYEAAKLDAIFVADIITGAPIPNGDVFLGSPYEPITALSALSAVTERIGLIGTFSTTWNHPYTLARQLQALDVLSGGRAGWNIVTSGGAQEHYGSALPSRDERYRRAEEVVEVVRALWGAWSDSAVIADRRSGDWVRPGSIQPIDFEGEFATVQGFLNQRRSPQGHPVLVQAGQSPSGLNFGAANGDLIYTAQPVLQKSVAYYAAYKERLGQLGRDPEQTKIIPGIVPYIADTQKEAEELFHSLDEFVDFDAARARFEAAYRVDLSDIDLDEKVPQERFQTDAEDSRIASYSEMAAELGFTLRRLLVDSVASQGHLVVVGTASTIADTMIEWFDGRACDGFSLNAPLVPSSVAGICEGLVPELRERGYFRSEYTGSTLREHLGIPVPPAWDA